jgi:hypothetical protein
LIGGFDLGIQQKEKRSKHYHHWFNLTAIGRIHLSQKINTAFRLEYFQDFNQAIIRLGTDQAFEVFGTSLNLDYEPNENIMIRAEGRLFHSKTPIFSSLNGMRSHNISIAVSMIFRFSKS